MLRFRTDKKSIIIRKLTYRYNLVFFEYKALSSYLSILIVILTSFARVIIFLTFKRTLRN
jgi:hypothetical protein